MLLKSMYLHHFRSYTNQKFDFSDDLAIIIGPNTAGKTNLSEAITLLLTGKSFRTSRDSDMIAFGNDIARAQGLLTSEELNVDDKTKLEVVIAQGEAVGGRLSKRFFVNGVAKSRNNFIGFLPLVLFRPEELDIIIDGPNLRRNFLDEVLEQVDRQYAQAKRTYERSLKQRNALLRLAQESGRRNSEQFAYWDDLLIENGQTLSKKRAEFLEFINVANHTIFPLQTTYDASTISRERLDQYTDAEVGAGVTLVGPHRDDFIVSMSDPSTRNARSGHDVDIRSFGSRGQQRLAVLQLKMLQISYIKNAFGTYPLLVLDDIFSELDTNHIQLVLDNTKGSQMVLTTTHKEFIPKGIQEKATMIELGK